MSADSKVRIGFMGAGQRAYVLIDHVMSAPGAEVTCLFDASRPRLEAMAGEKGLAGVLLTSDPEAALAPDLTDAVAITLPDRLHREFAVRALEAGKHVMLEKPMALTAADCRRIIRAKRRAGKVLQIGFVLRCAPFYRKVREVVDSGRLGRIMSIEASEQLGLVHGASYMRRWHRRKADSGSFMLSKCCHDLDLLSWLLGEQPERVASFGDRDYFHPSGRRASHCSLCPERESCPHVFRGGFVFMTEDEKRDPSKHDLDLCAFNEEVDIVDNQVVILEYPGGVRASFSLQLFSPEKSKRYITVIGSRGRLDGCLESNVVRVQSNRDDRAEEFDVSAQIESGHMGSDSRFMREFIETVRTGSEPVADLAAGLASTVVAQAIERARAERRVVEINPSEYEV